MIYFVVPHCEDGLQARLPQGVPGQLDVEVVEEVKICEGGVSRDTSLQSQDHSPP
jgi:hypothetical protein